MFYEYKKMKPVVHPSAYVHPQAAVTGNVIIGKNVYIGPGAAIRGDFGKIVIEDGCNVQENCTIHMFPGITVTLHENAHIGHGAIIHGATIGKNCLVGMNAVIMDDVIVGDECIIGALSFIKANTHIPPRSLMAGNPAKLIKEVSDEMIAWKTEGTKVYQQLAMDCHQELIPCEPLSEILAENTVEKIQYSTWDQTKSRKMNKLDFLKNDFADIVSGIDRNTVPYFGKMNVHQMIEHMAYAFRQAAGKIPLDPLHDEETTAKMYRFMMSDKPFKDDTPNPYLPDIPTPPEYANIDESVNQLKKDIDYFINTFTENKDIKILNPFFGNLNFDEWVQLLYKHALHHLRQFGILIQNNPSGQTP